MQDGLALAQHEKLWLGFNSQFTLSNDKKWISFLFSQLRMINKSHPLQTGLIEGGLGYRFFQNDSAWVGYRWSAFNPNNGFFQENQFFQQIISQRRMSDAKRFIIRSRLEEVARGNQSQIAIRFRERVGLEINRSFFIHALPFIYDEVFFQLNKTNYTSNKLITQNRLFLGINAYITKHSWWEIGYINQFEMHTPLTNENQMNHILSVNYNII